jgi:nucleotide-binding universal stress UspA family protein
MMFKTILIAYDGSDHAKNALQTAVELTRALKAQLHLVHTPQLDTPMVVAGPFVSILDAPPTKAQIAEAGSKIVEEAREATSAAGGEIVECHVGQGDPASKTLAVARQIDADMIVMGRRGLGALGSLAFGSVSQSVAHGATCPCLTVV